jgi:hypothetical protein
LAANLAPASRSHFSGALPLLSLRSQRNENSPQPLNFSVMILAQLIQQIMDCSLTTHAKVIQICAGGWVHSVHRPNPVAKPA